MLQAALWQYLGKIFGHRSLILSRGLKWAETPQNMQGKACFKRWWFQIPSRPTGELENEAFQSAAVSYYKAFESHRPHETCQPDSPFYLAVKYKRKDEVPVWYMKKPQGVNKIGKIPQTKARNKRPRL